MTITLSLNPNVEKGLLARARERGLTLEAYLRELMEKEASKTNRPPLTGKEKAQAFVAWAKGHRPTKPISEEAISRATLYPDRL